MEPYIPPPFLKDRIIMAVVQEQDPRHLKKGRCRNSYLDPRSRQNHGSIPLAEVFFFLTLAPAVFFP